MNTSYKIIFLRARKGFANRKNTLRCERLCLHPRDGASRQRRSLARAADIPTAVTLGSRGAPFQLVSGEVDPRASDGHVHRFRRVSG